MLGIDEAIRSIINLDNTYIGEAPVDVDNCQWITSMSGTTNIHFDKETYDYAMFNILCRDTDNQKALQRIQLIYSKLKNYVGADFIIIIERLPHYVGRDDKYRAIYSFRIEYQLGGY